MIVDLSRLAFLSSAGLAVLFGLAKHCVRIAVVAPVGAPFRRALEVAELSRVAHDRRQRSCWRWNTSREP